MLLEFDVQKLDAVLNDFYNVTGVGISILREDYSVLGAKRANNTYCRLVQSNKQGLAKCLGFNRRLLEKCKATEKPMVSICYAGLVEIALPIKYEERLIGFALLGHIKPVGGQTDVCEALSDLPVDVNLAKDIFVSLPTYDQTRLNSIVNMAIMFGKYLILENLVRPKENENLENIKRYVSQNVEKKLSAETISKGAHISRSTLYSTLNTHLGCTVSEFIGKVKIDRAKELLRNSDMPVEDISDKLGFSSPAYFGKVFKKLVGTSPLKYRKTSITKL